MGVVLPATAMPDDTFYRNGEEDEMLFVHEGTGVLRTNFGDLTYHPGDYLVLPIGTTWRLDPDAGVGQRMLLLECPSELEPPKRYRNEYGQLLEHSPYSQRDIRIPEFREPTATSGEYRVIVRARGRHTAYHFATHPFDVVGWDGYLWPYAFDIADFQPITGRVHQPPPVHQTFAGAQLRRLLVRAPQVRLPPARDPGAVQPQQHQQRRGHLLRRRQLHEPPRREHRVVHAPSGRASRTGRTRGRSRRRSARRRPRSWR